MPTARIVFWAATLGAIVVSVRAVVAKPPPLPIAIVLALAYLALLLAGIFVLRLRIFADAVVSGADLVAHPRGVVLTFDDGPDPTTTRKVLDVLDAHGAKATFFVIGHKAAAHPELVREMALRGHAVGVHGFAHDRLFSLRGTKRVRADLKRAVRTLETILERRPTLFRPPIGHTNPTIARVVDELDLEIVGWSVGAHDGLSRTKPSSVVARISRKLEDGAIVLLHDASERGGYEPAGVKALVEILQRIADKNLAVAHLPDWIASRDARDVGSRDVDARDVPPETKPSRRGAHDDAR